MHKHTVGRLGCQCPAQRKGPLISRAGPPNWLAADAWAGPLTLSADLADLSVPGRLRTGWGLRYRRLRQNGTFNHFWPGGGPDVGVPGLGSVRAGPSALQFP